MSRRWNQLEDEDEPAWLPPTDEPRPLSSSGAGSDATFVKPDESSGDIEMRGAAPPSGLDRLGSYCAHELASHLAARGCGAACATGALALAWAWFLGLAVVTSLALSGILTESLGAFSLILSPSSALLFTLALRSKLKRDPNDRPLRLVFKYGWAVLALYAFVGAPLGPVRLAPTYDALPASCVSAAHGFNATLHASERALFSFGPWLREPWGRRYHSEHPSTIEPHNPPPPTDLDVVFKTQPKTGEELKLSLWLPDAGACAPRGCPLVIYWHGGGWISGSRHGVMDSLVKKLVGEGIAVASPDYTLLGAPGLNLTDCYLDSRDALIYLRGCADEWRVDADAVTLMGFSAGAMLASLVGNRHPEWVVGIVSLAGRQDLRTGEALWSRATQRVYCGSPITDGDPCWRENSAITFASAESPKLLMIHGDSDATVPPENGRLMQRAMRRTGAASCDIEFPFGAHAMTQAAGSVAHQTAIAMTLNFVLRVR